jgi:Tfp pilus assembly protein PilN
MARLQEKARLTASELQTQSEAASLRKALDLKEAEIRKIEVLLVPSGEILNQLETSIPPGVKLTAIAAEGDELSCKGVAADYPALATFIRSAGQRENLTEARCALSEATDEGIRFEIQLKISRN